MKITQYSVYGTFDDLIKLYRRALKKGYSYGEIEPLTDDDKNVQMSWEYDRRRIYKNLKRKVIRINNRDPKYARAGVPKTLLYRNYSVTNIEKPDFELFKLTLTREY